MQNELTEMVFILDRSGSMADLVSQTIKGFNTMIEKQKKLEGEAVVSTVLFDDKFEVIHNRLSLKEVKPLTKKDYYVRGTTALLDAIGRSITKVKHLQENNQYLKPTKTIFIITTDGCENASREYSSKRIKDMIISQKELSNWQFIFLGANIDSLEVADSIGIDKEFASNYHADDTGTSLNYKAMSEAISSFRVNNSIDRNWKADVESDFKSRK